MKANPILTTRELAEYIQIHEKNAKILDEGEDYLKFMAQTQWRYELAAIDHFLLQTLMTSSSDDLDLVIQSGSRVIPLAQMVDETLIDLNVRADNKIKVLSRLAKMASHVRAATSYEDLFIELESREKVRSTGVGNGIAIPHSRFPHQMQYRRPKLFIIRLNVGIDFGAMDDHKVCLFFMPCAPTQFILFRMLAQIAKVIQNDGAIARLKNTMDKRDVLSIINF
jgi:PTS system nitrogen regulatory IIA component